MNVSRSKKAYLSHHLCHTSLFLRDKFFSGSRLFPLALFIAHSFRGGPSDCLYPQQTLCLAERQSFLLHGQTEKSACSKTKEISFPTAGVHPFPSDYRPMRFYGDPSAARKWKQAGG